MRAVQSPPRTLHVRVPPDVSLEVIDWGGRGTPLVFLAGGGHTAREFYDFAPRLADQFRVIGITRRGRGASSDVPPASIGDLVDDIVAVLDDIGLSSVVLVGHSFAGSEMTLFGERFGERCLGLVFLDAAYDYTDPGLGVLMQATPPPQAPPMLSSDSASVDTVRRYYQRVSNFALPTTEILATRSFDDSGKLLGGVPSQTQRRLGSLQRSPQWGEIRCPSLGMFAVPRPPDTWLPYYSELDQQERQAAAAYLAAFADWTAAEREEFGRWPQNTVVEFPSSNHYFFLEQPDLAAQLIREFAATLN